MHAHGPLLLWVTFTAIGAQAFCPCPSLASCSRWRGNKGLKQANPSGRDVFVMMATSDSGATPRRDFAQALASGTSLAFMTFFSPVASRSAAAVPMNLVELDAQLMLCKEIFRPTLQYLKAQQFDAARTNTNYITRFLNVKKTIDALVVAANDIVEDPEVMEKAVDLAQEAEATFTNFDSSVYTIIFIPGDENGVLPPGAEKYLKQAYGYYNDILQLFDFYITLVPPDTQEKAKALLPAKKADLPKFLFKENDIMMKEKM